MSYHQDINNDFCRCLLSEVHKDVKKALPEVKLREASVYRVDGRSFEFRYKEFYWYGRAFNAWEARAKGWEAYLRDLERKAVKHAS